jgi:hypothetical protein
MCYSKKQVEQLSRMADMNVDMNAETPYDLDRLRSGLILKMRQGDSRARTLLASPMGSPYDFKQTRSLMSSLFPVDDKTPLFETFESSYDPRTQKFKWNRNEKLQSFVLGKRSSDTPYPIESKRHKIDKIDKIAKRHIREGRELDTSKLGKRSRDLSSHDRPSSIRRKRGQTIVDFDEMEL